MGNAYTDAIDNLIEVAVAEGRIPGQSAEAATLESAYRLGPGETVTGLMRSVVATLEDEEGGTV